MATLGDVLSEIFAPRPEVGGPSRLGGPEQEPFSIPVSPDNGPSNGMAPINATPDGAAIDALRRMFGGTPQPPDGMDSRTYAPGNPSLARSAMPSAQSQPQTWPDPPHYKPDTDEGYSKKFGFITDGNDPAREAQMVPSLDRSRPAPRPGAVVPTAGPGMAPDRGADMPFRRAAPPTADGPANSELARAFRAFFQGAAGVNPSSPAFSAFAQGAAGAMKTQFDERQKEALLARQQSKDALDETLKLSKHDRDEALADSLIGYRKTKSNPDTGGLRYQDIAKQRQDLNGIERARARRLDQLSKDYSLSADQKKKKEQEINEEFDRERDLAREQYKQRSLTPDMGNAPQKKEAKPPQQSGDGKSPQSPVMTTDPKVIQGMPKGSYYINPADGQVYQKN